MKILHIHAKLKFNKELLKKISIKEKFNVATTIQYLDEIRKYFPDAKQILGCSNLNSSGSGEFFSPLLIEGEKNIKGATKTYLYIGTGEFHSLRLARFAEKVYILNPETKQFYQLNPSDIKQYRQQIITNQKKFLMSKSKGILVSVKSGQYHLTDAIALSKKYKAKIFLFNTLSEYELENFAQIDCWINTACQRIEGKNIINPEDLPN